MVPGFRNLLCVFLGGLGVMITPHAAVALDYPRDQYAFLVGFPAGSTSDVVARLIAQRLSERLDQPFVVEDRTGASGNIAAESVANAPADGYTLLFAGSNNAINDTLFDNLPFNFNRDIAPIAGMSKVLRHAD